MKLYLAEQIINEINTKTLVKGVRAIGKALKPTKTKVAFAAGAATGATAATAGASAVNKAKNATTDKINQIQNTLKQNKIKKDREQDVKNWKAGAAKYYPARLKTLNAKLKELTDMKKQATKTGIVKKINTTTTAVENEIADIKLYLKNNK